MLLWMLEFTERRSGLPIVVAYLFPYILLWSALPLSGLKLSPNLKPPDSKKAVVVAAVEGGP